MVNGYGLNVCIPPPPNSYVKIQGIGRGAFGRRLGREDRAGIRVIKEEGAQTSQPLPASEGRVRTRRLHPGRGSSPEPEPGGVTISDFLPPEM